MDRNGQQDLFEHIGLNGWHFSKMFRDIFNKVTGLEIIEEKCTPESENRFNRQISGILILTGEKDIMISVSMSFNSATTIVAHMTNMQPADIKLEEQSDGLEELTNMLAGQIKARLAATGHRYTYMQPFTIVGDNHCILQKRKVNSVNTKFHSGAIEMLMSVSVQ